MKIIDAHLHLSGEPYFHEIAQRAGHVNSREHLAEQYATLDIAHGVVMTGGRGPRREEHRLADFLSYCIGINSAWLQPGELAETLPFVRQHLLWEECVGIKLYPGYEDYSVADPICDPLYELAEEYAKPVAVHTGYTASGETSRWCHPDTVAQAARRWPGVRFVMCHMGNPWIDDGVAAMRQHDNIAADLSGILEGRAESVEALLRGMGSFFPHLLQALSALDDYSRVLFGTDWPLANLSQYIAFVKRLIPAEHHAAVFYDNAARIYGLRERNA